MFLCTGNSCRSQMAEGWARALHGSWLDAYSAGTRPGTLDPRARAAMSERGVDISAQRSKHVDDLGGVRFDLVVTVCDSAREACPVFPSAEKTVHSPFDDPPRLAKGAAGEEEAMGHYRRVRDEIKAFIESLPDRLPRA